jgi:hypothetical protein
VASLLHDTGASDEVVAAGVLHDVAEKGDADPAELRARFGDRVAALVAVLSEDPAIEDFEARKRALREQVGRAGGDALLIFVADKVSKVRELRLELLSRAAGRPSAPNGAARLRHYHASLRLAQERIPQEPLVARLRSELDTTAGRRLTRIAI